ncbi:MAG: peptide ABC transporter substrate-binding protein, partial [Anaerolineales bacterium]|nr:peptide ABC transporter substrate-binding protein [Anaerolineales bacterium]
EQVQSAGTCTVIEPALGGSFVEGMVGAPRFLNPLLSDANPVDRELVNLIFDGLVRYDDNGRLTPALARAWDVGEDGLSVTFQLRDDVTWHDGAPLTAADVAFTYGLLQQEGFPDAALRALWQTVTITVVDPQTVQFVLQEPYAPFLEATTRGILPAHLLGGVTAAELAAQPFNLAPVGTGPFVVPPGQAPAQTGQLRLLPSPARWPQGIKLDDVVMRFFPDAADMAAAFAAGEIHAIRSVPAEVLPTLLQAADVRLISSPAPRYTALWFDMGETAVSELAVRQALARALDRARLVDEVLQGQGVPLDGPFLPGSWAYRPDLLTAYAPDTAAAVALLESAGWLLPEGQAVRQRDEQPLALQLLFLETAPQRALAEGIRDAWQLVGVAVQLNGVPTPEALLAALAERAYDVALLDVTPPRDPDQYDFWSQEAMIDGQNYAGWNDRRASEALERARQVWPVAERRPYYETFLRQFDAALPALVLYQHVDTYAVRGDVNDVEIGRIDQPRDRFESLGSWFLGYREVSVLCLPTEPG